jgi:hypothetical protein
MVEIVSWLHRYIYTSIWLLGGKYRVVVNVPPTNIALKGERPSNGPLDMSFMSLIQSDQNDVAPEIEEQLL